MKIKVKLYLFFLLVCSFSYGQIDQYSYKREINDVSNKWHQIVLPDAIYKNVSTDLSDIRIFGIKENRDTIEVPFIYRTTEEKIDNRSIAYQTINKSHNEKGYLFTFEISKTEIINEIKLKLKQENFDWKIKLEGSQDLQQWKIILEDYRILSLKNDIENYAFTVLKFPDSQYRYFRLFIPSSKEEPILKTVQIIQQKIHKGIYKDYPFKKVSTNNNKQKKQTEIHVELQQFIPINQLKIAISDNYDYYRPITIQYLRDSVETELGWHYQYTTLASGTLNSLEKNLFKFNSTLLDKLKIIIDNQNNQPLTIDTITAKGYLNELVARFTEPAKSYYLVYGNNNAIKPVYDIQQFVNKIPEKLVNLSLNEELTITKQETPVTPPFFKNKAWLWGIIGSILILLSWFSIKMLRNI